MAELCAERAERPAKSLAEGAWAQPGCRKAAAHKARSAQTASRRLEKPGWVAHKFKEKFGHWPPTKSVRPIEPSREVLSWVRSRNIAYAKARKAAAA
jgi:hypothetical protein